MKDTALYEQLLGLSDPWSVKQVKLSLEDNRLTIEVELKCGIVWVDPEVKGARAFMVGLNASGGILIPASLKPSSRHACPNYRSSKIKELAVTLGGAHAASALAGLAQLRSPSHQQCRCRGVQFFDTNNQSQHTRLSQLPELSHPHSTPLRKAKHAADHMKLTVNHAGNHFD